MGSRERPNLGGSGEHSSRRVWAQKKNPKELLVNGRFDSFEDVNLYLSGDLITCLECGQDCKSLGLHLSRVHSKSSREYKIKYNIPLQRSLRGESTRRNASAAMKVAWMAESTERREKQRQFAKSFLVGVGTFAPRTSSVKREKVLHVKQCKICNKEFKYASSRSRKYCSQECCKVDEEFKQRLRDQGQKGGLIRAATGAKDSMGKFVKKDA